MNRLTASIALAASVSTALADCPPDTTLTPTTPYIQQAFGSSVDFYHGGEEKDVLIGAPRDTVGNVGTAGAVSVFRTLNNADWAFSQLLTAPSGASCDFGRSICVMGTAAAIGAPGSDGGCTDGGAVYFSQRSYETGAWSTPQRFTIAAADDTDWIGRSVGIFDNNSGIHDWMVAGAPGDDSDLMPPLGEETTESGAVHVWRRLDNGPWVYAQRLRRTAPLVDLASNQEFGHCVALSANQLLVGAPGGEVADLDLNTGIVMIYKLDENNQWVSQTGIGHVHPLAGIGDGYGYSASGVGGVFVVGAPRGDSTAAETPLVGAKTDCGYIDILVAGQNGVQSAGRIFAPDAENGAWFGYSVAMRQGEIVVGTLTPTGKAYVYRKSGNNWNQWTLARVLHNDRVNTSFGNAVACTYDWVAVPDAGEPYGQPGYIKGIAYLYKTNDYKDPYDSCAGAAYNPVPCEGTYTGCSSEYTLGAYTTCGGMQSAQGPDLFYAYTPLCSGVLTADTLGSAFDTVLSVHSSCPPNINPNNPNALTNTIVCNDDDAQSGTLQSRVVFNAVAGQTYIFRIAGYNGQSGDFTFNLRSVTPPANDDCADAQVVGAGATPFATCGSTLDGPYGPFACLDQPQMTCGREVWFRYTAPGDGTVTVGNCDANFDSMLQVFPAGACPPDPLASIVCRDDSFAAPCDGIGGAMLDFPVTGGASYLIRVGSGNGEFFAATGVATLTIDFVGDCPCDWNGSGSVSVQDIFDFLGSYFSGNADFNNSGATSVQDIFDFLACYFAGCA